MTTTPSFSAGDRLRIEYVNCDQEFKALDGVKVADATATGLTLVVPTDMGPLESGNPVKLIRFEDQRRYEAVVHVVEPLAAGATQLQVRRPERIQNLPRRDYFRVKTMLPVLVDEELKGTFRDMSASGGLIGFREPQRFEVSQVLELEFTLPDDREPTIVEAEVVRLAGTEERPRISVRFLPLPKRTADSLLRYLHQCELDSRAWLRS